MKDILTDRSLFLAHLCPSHRSDRDGEGGRVVNQFLKSDDPEPGNPSITKK